jgi:hypothetical protein
MVLLTFKPHVGALVLLAAVGWLLLYGGGFGRRAIRFAGAAALLLFTAGFLADPLWVIRYPQMLLSYQDEGNVSGCTECASLPVTLSRALLDGSLANAVWIAIALLLLSAGILFKVRSEWTSHEMLLSAAVLITLLVSPYLYNYDFLLLLVPFAVLFHRGAPFQRIVVLLCYLVPTFALLLLGRAGNASLLSATLVLMGLLALSMFRDKKPVIDSPASEAYNTDN